MALHTIWNGDIVRWQSPNEHNKGNIFAATFDHIHLSVPCQRPFRIYLYTSTQEETFTLSNIDIAFSDTEQIHLSSDSLFTTSLLILIQFDLLIFLFYHICNILFLRLCKNTKVNTRSQILLCLLHFDTFRKW